MRKSLVLLSLCAACLSAMPARAQFVQQRFLPANGERGRLGDPQPMPMVQVGGRLLRLAPGGRIYDQSNRSIVHGNLPAGADVLFTRDANGDIQRIYILTAQEQARLAGSPRR